MHLATGNSISASRAVYVHFFDRELLSTLELYDYIDEKIIFNDFIILLLSTYELLYFSTSLLFENRFAKAAIDVYPSLFQEGHISLIMREYGFEEFSHSKRLQYEHSPEKYSFYFDNTWEKFAVLNPSILQRSFDTTTYLESSIITDINQQGIDDTSKRLGISYDMKAVNRLKPYIEESIYERKNKAITKELFSNIYQTQKAKTYEKKYLT